MTMREATRRLRKARAHWYEDAADHVAAVADDTAADTAEALGVDVADVRAAALQVEAMLRRLADRTEPPA